MFSIIETGGKQYAVTAGKKLKVEKLQGAAGDAVVFDKVLLVAASDDDVTVGTPYVSGAKVSGEIIRQDRAKKLIVFRYKAKKRQQKKKGHRQPFTDSGIVEPEYFSQKLIAFAQITSSLKIQPSACNAIATRWGMSMRLPAVIMGRLEWS